MQQSLSLLYAALSIPAPYGSDWLSLPSYGVLLAGQEEEAERSEVALELASTPSFLGLRCALDELTDR